MVKKINALIHGKNTLTSASIILIVTLFLSNVLGVLRDHYLTQKIPTHLLSSYFAAFTIPDFIFNVLILGAMTAAFIPIFTTLIAQKKSQEAWLVASSVINIAIIFLIFFSIILFCIMPYVVPLVVPGFDIANKDLTIKLARIMLGSPIFFGISYIFGGILNSYKRFLVYSLAPLVYNLVIILGTYFFADKYSVTAVAIAVVIGAFLHFLIQFPVAIRLGFRWQFKIAFHHWGVRRIGLLMIPRSIALGANQIMLLIFTAIASSLGGYSIAAYNLANNIQTMPTVVFGTSFATAVFPNLAEAISKNENQKFASQIERITRIILFFMIPLTVMFILLRTEIVRLILGSGFFGWEQTVVTANILGFFALSFIFSGLAPLFSRSFYALHDTKIPMILTILNVIVSIVFGKLFSLKMGVAGLALGFSIGSLVGTLALYIMLRKRTVIVNEKQILWFAFKIILAAVLAGIAIEESKIIVGLAVDMQRFWGVLVKTIVSLGIGAMVYLLCCWIFGCEEIRSIGIILNKFSNKGIDETELEQLEK